MQVIGLTGGIACGKSTVTDMLRKAGAAIVIDADELVHNLYKTGNRGWIAITHWWGMRMVNDDGNINRKKLAEIVFADEEEKKILESKIHPLVEEEFINRLGKLTLNGVSTVVYDMPLLFEADADKHMSSILCVRTSAETQIQRLMKRNGFDRKEAQRRIDAQMSLEEKVKRSHYVISNDGTRDDTAHQLTNYWKLITGKTFEFKGE